MPLPITPAADQKNWCKACERHSASGMLCPVCLDDKAHGVEVLIRRRDEDEGKGAE